MGTNITNNHNNDNGMAVLGVITVTGMVLSLFFATLALCLMLGLTYSTAYFGYKVYQLRVHKTISLAQIAAGQIPHPTLPIERDRRLPPMKEILMGRDR